MKCPMCGEFIDNDMQYCRNCGEFVEPECPHDGDNTNCESCAYYPDYEWDPIKGDCIKKED